MPFQKMTIDDIPVIAPYFRFVTTNTCDFTVGGMFMWRDYFHMAWQVKDGVLYSTLTGEDGNLYYNLPLGEDIPPLSGGGHIEKWEEGPLPLPPIFQYSSPSVMICDHSTGPTAPVGSKPSCRWRVSTAC